jgi:alkyl hydroperoxide reductase subunit AhpF
LYLQGNNSILGHFSTLVLLAISWTSGESQIHSASLILKVREFKKNLHFQPQAEIDSAKESSLLLAALPQLILNSLAMISIVYGSPVAGSPNNWAAIIG